MSSFRLCVRLLIAFSLALIPPLLTAQDVSSTKKFSDQVVKKAEEILAEVNLRRSGRLRQSTDTSKLSRAISGLNKSKRELRLVHQDWKIAFDVVANLQHQINLTKAQYAEYNLQLSRVRVGDITTNNRIVGMINATNAKLELLVRQRDPLKAQRAAKRAALDKAESSYAETVLAIRADFTTLQNNLTKLIADEQVQIAFRVLHTNFETPERPTATMITAALDKRIERIEQEIFHETIKMDVESGSLYVDVVVGKKHARMVVDSGATLITLPAKTAQELGVIVPPDARPIKMVLADGRVIPALGVTLPKVRIGGFEAEQVDAAVLDATASNAEPLLGLSFLSNFKFEINTNEQTLKLLRVESE